MGNSKTSFRILPSLWYQQKKYRTCKSIFLKTMTVMTPSSIKTTNQNQLHTHLNILQIKRNVQNLNNSHSPSNCKLPNAVGRFGAAMHLELLPVMTMAKNVNPHITHINVLSYLNKITVKCSFFSFKIVK